MKTNHQINRSKKHESNRSRVRGLLLTVAMPVCMTAFPALGQQDRDPATEQLLRAALGPVGQAKFIGSKGFLDYENPTPVSERALTPLFTLGEAEAAEALRPYQSRGRRAELDWALLDRITQGQEDRASLPLFDEEEWELVFVMKEERTPTRYTWFGQVAGVATSDFILVRHDDVIHLTVHDYERKKSYEAYSVPDAEGRHAWHTFRKYADIRPDEECGSCRPGTPIKTPTDSHSHGVGGGYGERATADQIDIVDVLFVCTNEARAALGDSGFYSLAQACVDSATVRSSNSGAGVTFRIMDARPDVANYAQSGEGGVDLGRLQNPGDGFMDGVNTLRSSSRADLVCLFRSSNWGNTVGVGYRPGTLDQIKSPSGGFSVVSLQSADIGRTFAHEVGHNLGACHDVAAAGCNGDPYLTATPHGYVRECDVFFCTLRWHTTMAYQINSSCDSSTPLPYYSNPAVGFDPPGACGAAGLGDGISNVAQLMVYTRQFVSQHTIAATQSWTFAPFGTGGNGTRFAPFGLVRNAVNTVQGGAAEGVVQVFSGTYNETASAGGPVLLSNPCVVRSVDGAPAWLR